MVARAKFGRCAFAVHASVSAHRIADAIENNIFLLSVSVIADAYVWFYADAVSASELTDRFTQSEIRLSITVAAFVFLVPRRIILEYTNEAACISEM